MSKKNKSCPEKKYQRQSHWETEKPNNHVKINGQLVQLWFGSVANAAMQAMSIPGRFLSVYPTLSQTHFFRLKPLPLKPLNQAVASHFGNKKSAYLVYPLMAVSLLGAQQIFAAPGGIDTGIKMWVKADSGVDCSTEGCQPTTWSDQISGTAFGKVGTTAYLELKANNFNPAVNFGGQSHFKAAFDPVPSTNTQFTLFSVGKRNDTSGK